MLDGFAVGQRVEHGARPLPVRHAKLAGPQAPAQPRDFRHEDETVPIGDQPRLFQFRAILVTRQPRSM